MSSPSSSQPDSMDLAYDMWAGQFEFVGPTTNNNNNNNNNNATVLNNNKLLNNNNKVLKFGSDKHASHKGSTESIEDLDLNFNMQCSLQNRMQTQQHHPHTPILIDQETFLSLNPADFDDIVPSSGPNSLVIIDNKFTEDIYSNDNNNNINNNNNKLNNIENYKLNKSQNAFIIENLKNLKNKLLNHNEEKNVSETSGQQYHKMQDLSAELCENLNEQVSSIPAKNF